tara:strand:- start:3642 stop:3929 length:288 start_codon:yes stop_codon:yes gene_type:complete
MPKYFYKCLEEDCEQVFEIVHSMKDKLKTCSQCSSECKKEGNIERVPINIVTMLKKPTTHHAPTKTGALVKKNIEEFRQALKKEKKRLEEVEYKP